jgi:hypothetical protein
MFVGFAPGEMPIVFEGPPEMKSETSATVNIAFPAYTSRIAGKPVVSALIEARHFVAEVVELFEAKFSPTR